MALAEIVDPTALWQTAVGALVTGIGVTAAFSIAVFGIARFIDLGRDGRSFAAVGFGALAAVALVACGGAIVTGVIVMTSK